MCQWMKYPKDMRVIFVIDTIDEDVLAVPIKESLGIDAVVAVIMNFDFDGIADYDKMVSTLINRC